MKRLWMYSIMVFALAQQAFGQELSPVPTPIESLQTTVSLPDLPPLSFQLGDLSPAAEAQLAVHFQDRNQRDRAILAKLQEGNAVAEQLIAQNQEVKGLLSAEAARKEQAIAWMNGIAKNFQLTVERLSRSEQNLAATQGQLAGAQANVNAAYAALEYEKSWAWVPAPISTVLRLFE